jgi:hypothetical protein
MIKLDRRQYFHALDFWFSRLILIAGVRSSDSDGSL